MSCNPNGLPTANDLGDSPMRREQRQLAADAVLQQCQMEGAVVALYHRNYAPIYCWAVPGEETVSERSLLKSTVDQITQKSFVIPYQGWGNIECVVTASGSEQEATSGFPPPAGVSVEDYILYNNFKYYVKEINADSLGAVYTLATERTQNRRKDGK